MSAGGSLSARGPRPRRAAPSAHDVVVQVLGAQPPEDPPSAGYPRAPPGAPPRGRGRAHSASPRESYVRPVDTVRVAKSELVQSARGQTRAARLRLAALPDAGTGAPAPGLHEGFYDFAAAVVKPAPSARQHAAQLQQRLGSQLRELGSLPDERGAEVACAEPAARAPLLALPAPEVSGTFLTLPDSGAGYEGDGELVALPKPDARARERARASSLEGAETARRKVELCLEVLQDFAKDTTTECKERAALFESARSATSAALAHLVDVARERVKDASEAEEAKRGAEERMADLEEDNANLRHVIQQMLGSEARLREDVHSLDQERQLAEVRLAEAKQQATDLALDLESVSRDAHELEQEQTHGRDVTDSCNSPMMGFSHFALGPDAVPPPPDVTLSLGFDAGADLRSNISGLTAGMRSGPSEARAASARRGGPGETWGAAAGFQGSQRAHEEARRPSISEAADARAVANQRSHEPTCDLPTPSRSASAASSVAPDAQRLKSDAPSMLRLPAASPLAASFPALIPFIDLSIVDSAGEDAAQAVSRQNREQLEKHLVLLEADYQAEVSKNARLQSSVDAAAERLLVWLQAEHDSLQDLGTSLVEPDVKVLASIRDVVKWLALHPVKAWSDPPGTLERVLDDREEPIRACLAAERPSQQGVEGLRQALEKQKQRSQELAEQLREARAQAAPSKGSRRLGAPKEKQGNGEGPKESPASPQPRLEAVAQMSRSSDAPSQAAPAAPAVVASDAFAQTSRGFDPPRAPSPPRCQFCCHREHAAAEAQTSRGFDGYHGGFDAVAQTSRGFDGTSQSAGAQTSRGFEGLPQVAEHGAQTSRGFEGLPQGGFGGTSQSAGAQTSRGFEGLPQGGFGGTSQSASAQTSRGFEGLPQVAEHSTQVADGALAPRRRQTYQGGSSAAPQVAARSQSYQDGSNQVCHDCLQCGFGAAPQASRAGALALEAPGFAAPQAASAAPAGLGAASPGYGAASPGYGAASPGYGAGSVAEGSQEWGLQLLPAGQEGSMASVEFEPETGPPPPSGVAGTDGALLKLQLLHSHFVRGIDMVAVPAEDRIMRERGDPDASPPAAGDGLLSLKQLRHVIAQAYTDKKADDLRRDKVHEPRRELHVVLQETLRRQHGVKRVAHQKSWILVKSLLRYATADRLARTFAEFLDGSRDVDELSFYLYCTSVFPAATAVESQAHAPSRPIAGWVAVGRATRMVELLFGDLPKALDLVKVELEKFTRALPSARRPDAADGFHGEQPERSVPIEDLHTVLLEGWRLSQLLLDKGVAGFSWRDSVRAFLQCDASRRGWLDPHEVREAEEHRLRLPPSAAQAESLRILDATSLGAFVFRAVHRCSAGAAASGARAGTDRSSSILRAQTQTAMGQACLETSMVAFEQLERTLGVYLTWLMHSEDQGDQAFYHSLKARIYGFRQAADAGSASGTHHLRCLVLLVLAHQFDVQQHTGTVAQDHLQWELTSLLKVLRESWRRGCTEFGDELEEVGQDVAEGWEEEQSELPQGV